MDTRTRSRRSPEMEWNPARHGIVEPAPLANSDFHFTILVFPSDTIVLTSEKEQTAWPEERSDKLGGSSNGSGRGSNGNHVGGTGGDYGWVFDSLGPDDADTIKNLRVFHEIGIEFQNGAKSFRQISKRIADRWLSNSYPTDLPWSVTAISHCREKVVEFFDERLGLGGDPLFRLSGKGGAMKGLTEKGWSLWEETTAYLIRREFISDNYLTDCA